MPSLKEHSGRCCKFFFFVGYPYCAGENYGLDDLVIPLYVVAENGG